MSVISSITVENIQDHNRWTVVLFTSKSSSANGPACNAAARDARSNFKICFALHDKYFRHIAALNPPGMLHRNKRKAAKEVICSSLQSCSCWACSRCRYSARSKAKPSRLTRRATTTRRASEAHLSPSNLSPSPDKSVGMFDTQIFAVYSCAAR